MPDLSACYFCGAAADAQVREYDVVPNAIDETLRSTATLCPGCREKLEAVLSTVARGAGPNDNPVDVALAAVDGDGDAAAAAADDPIDLDSEDLFESDGPVDEPPSNDSESGTAGRSSVTTGDEGIAFDAESESTAAETDENESTGAPETATSAASDAERSATDSGPTESDAGSEDDGGRRSDDAPASSETTGTGAADGQTAAEADVERPDAQIYNKIIRLLQNREFPVNRSEFSELATSAYDISPDECAQVIDYAIHRGELREDRGMLKKP